MHTHPYPPTPYPPTHPCVLAATKPTKPARALARSTGFERTKKDVVSVVHIGENTLAKRLNEFATTSAGDLTAEEFQARLGQQQGVGGGRACGWVVGWVGMCRHGLCKWGRAVAGDGGCCVENVLLGVEPATLLPKPHLLINCRTTRAVLQPKTPTPPHPGFASPSRLHPPQPCLLSHPPFSLLNVSHPIISLPQKQVEVVERLATPVLLSLPSLSFIHPSPASPLLTAPRLSLTFHAAAEASGGGGGGGAPGHRVGSTRPGAGRHEGVWLRAQA